MTAQREEAEQATNDAKRERQELLAKYTSLEDERTQDSLRIQKLQRELDSVSAQHTEAVQAAGAARREKQEAFSKHNDLDGERAQDSLRYQKLQRELENLSAQHSEAIQEASDARRAREQALSAQSSLESKQLQDGVRQQQLQRDLQTMTAERDTLLEARSSLQSQLRSLTQRLTEADTTLIKRESATAHIDARIEALRASIDGADADQPPAALLGHSLDLNKQVLQLEQEVRRLGKSPETSAGREATSAIPVS